MSEFRLVTHCSVSIECPNGKTVKVSNVYCSEAISVLKMSLSEYTDSCYYSCYNFVLTNNEDDVVSEYTEIGSILSEQLSQCTFNTQVPELSLKMIEDDYDVKKARAHVKKIRDIIQNPPLGDINKLGKLLGKNASKAVEYPSYNMILSTSDPSLGFFFDETLYKMSRAVPSGATSNKASFAIPNTAAALGEKVTALVLSDFNPPPNTRQLLGDLLYVQATVHEGTFHITAVAAGFYVNRTRGDLFDASPAAVPHFRRTLFELLLALSPSFASAWESHTALHNKGSRAVGDGTSSFLTAQPLETIAYHFAAGRGDQVTPLQWLVPPDQRARLHMRDPWRVQLDLCDSFGVPDDKGPLREWNDEFQSVTEMTVTELPDKITKTRLLHRTAAEFVESSRAAVAALVGGHLVPLNPMDPPEAQVFVYNNIFFSKAADTRESFRLCAGDTASRKTAGHDIKNQRLLQALGLSGLSSVLSVIVDCRGQRVVAQSVVPGVLSGGGGARLMYGVMEFGKRISCKTAALEAMQKVGRQLRMPVRRMAAVPVPALSSAAPSDNSMQEPSSIRVDELDEVSPEGETVPHVGPVEGKILRGSDGRLYALEMVRLSPRDANYVPCSVAITAAAEGEAHVASTGEGTGCIPAAVLQLADRDVAVTHVLRHELLPLFLQRKLLEKRQQMVAEEAATVKAQSASGSETTTDGAAPIQESDAAATTPVSGQDVGSAATTEGTSGVAPSAVESRDLSSRQLAVGLDSIDFAFSPNAFVRRPAEEGAEAEGPWLPSDMDSVVAAQDEESVREICRFLYCQLLPGLTADVRQNEVSVLGGDMLREVLHARGINLRYLGRLAELAQEEESEDLRMGAAGKQRIHVMSHYWLELLEMEMLARAVRKVLTERLRLDKRAAAVPGLTVVSMLNYIFGSLGPEPVSFAATGPVQAEEEKGPESDARKKKRRHKHKTGAAGGATAAAGENAASAEELPRTAPDALPERAQFLTDVYASARRQFLYSLSLVHAPSSIVAPDHAGEQESADKEAPVNPLAAPAPAAQTFLGSRLPRLTLLRRLCQLCGIRLVARDYRLDSPTPFGPEDVHELVPRVKSATVLDTRADTPVLPEAMSLIHSARRLTLQGDFNSAFEVAHEASVWLHDCVGPIHRDYRMALDELTAVCIAAGEFEQALVSAGKCLAISAQVDGLDSSDTAQQHLRLATVYLGLVGQLRSAVQLLENSSSASSTTESVSTSTVAASSTVPPPAESKAGDPSDPQEGDKTAEPANKTAAKEGVGSEGEKKLDNAREALLSCKRAALSHLFAARYLIELIGGPRHPDLVNVYLKLGTFLVEEEGQFQAGIVCLISQVKLRSTDLVQFASVCTYIAECYFHQGYLPQAADEMRQCYKVMTELFGPTDPRTLEVKSRLETYFRANGEASHKQKEFQLSKQIASKLELTRDGLDKKLTLSVTDEERRGHSNKKTDIDKVVVQEDHSQSAAGGNIADRRRQHVKVHTKKTKK